MLKGRTYVPRKAALVAVVIALFVGALIVSVPAWAGHPLTSDSSRVPMYVTRESSTRAILPTSGFAPVVKKVLPAVVNISSTRMVRAQNEPMPFDEQLFNQFFQGQQWRDARPREQREQSLGSGVIVSPDGYILTNNHVVDGSKSVKVSLPDKREFTGKVIGTDPKTDIAVVKINATDLPTVTLGNPSNLQIGDYVLAIGDPFGIGETVTMGIVSAKGRGGLDIEDYEDFIQTDAAINPGNSGGALINAEGDLVGINTAILSASGGGNQGIGFAIPVNLAKYVMGQILEHGKVVRGYIGASVQEVTPVVAKVFGDPHPSGAIIGEVLPDGPAATAGLKQGDIILALNGTPIDGPNQLRLNIAQLTPGTTAQLKVLRDHTQRDMAVKIGQLPEKNERASLDNTDSDTVLSGLHVQNLTPEIAGELHLSAMTKGVVVTDVAPDSPAADAGLRRGDVIEQINGHVVVDSTQYRELAKQAGKQPALVLVDHQGTTVFVTIEAS